MSESRVKKKRTQRSKTKDLEDATGSKRHLQITNKYADPADLKEITVPDSLVGKVQKQSDVEEGGDDKKKRRKSKLTRTMSKEMKNQEQEQTGRISYYNLINHINYIHPRRKGQPFEVFEKINSHQMCRCKEPQKITDLNKEIGLGASLFLMSTRSLAQVLLILSLINLPLYLFYYQAGNMISTGIADEFAKISFGNLGGINTSFSCYTSNYAVEKDLSLSCSYGELAEIQLFGLAKEDTNCHTLRHLNTFEARKAALMDECVLDGVNGAQSALMDENTQKFFLDYFKDVCQGQSTCRLPLKSAPYNINDQNRFVHDLPAEDLPGEGARITHIVKTSVQDVADEELVADTVFSQTCSDTLLARSKNSKYLSAINQERYAAERAQPPSPAVEPIVVAIASC